MLQFGADTGLLPALWPSVCRENAMNTHSINKGNRARCRFNVANPVRVEMPRLFILLEALRIIYFIFYKKQNSAANFLTG